MSLEIIPSKRASRDMLLDDFDFELDYGEGVLADFSRASYALEELALSRVGSSFMADPSQQDVHIKAMANDRQNYMWEEEDLLLRSQAMPHHPARNQVAHVNSRTHSISIKSMDESYHTAMDTDDMSMNQPRRPSDEYSQALMKLAYSMQRTEESRKQVMLQRSLLTPDQQQALKIAKEQFRVQTELIAQKSQQVQTSNNTYSRQVNAPPISSSSIIDAFFSGSRGSLTTGLDQSRMQLNNYMGNVHQRSSLSSFLG
jgi:hypothetical protein